VSGERIASLIHNARNRLCTVIDRLDEREAAELHVACGQLAGAMALLKLDDPEGGMRREEIDLELFFSDLMDEAARLAPPHLRTTGTADFSACLFRCWTFDSQLIRLVLVDGLMNAWRHARQWVRLEAGCRDGELYFAIQDDGPGFPAAWLAASGNADTDLPKPHGTGQGLRLARRIAEMHSADKRRGRIELANDGASGGARFCLILP